MKKYIVIGGEVTSSNDGQIHYIGPQRLCELYKVDPKECILVDRRSGYRSGYLGYDLSDDMRVLLPRECGDYTLRKRK